VSDGTILTRAAENAALVCVLPCFRRPGVLAAASNFPPGLVLVVLIVLGCNLLGDGVSSLFNMEETKKILELKQSKALKILA
jgi:hypothetical protein